MALLLAVVCPLSTWADEGETPQVRVSRDTITFPWYTSEPIYKVQPRKNSALWPQKDTKKRDGSHEFKRLLIENRFLRVEVLPEAGGVVGGAVYKPTDEDIFFREGKAKNWLPFWESGVKANFPWREHCIATTGQPAGVRVVRGEDGSVTIAQWMEFSRHDEPWHSAMYGRFSNMLLSQHVTLRPGEAVFHVTYRLTNPSPYRQGLRLWTDALMPRNHTKDGIVQGDAKPPSPTRTEWIFPAAWVADHRALNIRRYRPKDNLIRKHTKDHNSVFSLEMDHGFAGLWYPQVKVNRLRVWDPNVAKGAKQYFRGESTYRPNSYATHMYNFCELWGGFDNVMEGVENWIGPGETRQFTHAYAMVTGIGKVDYANRHLALNAEFDRDPRLEVVPLRPIEKLTARLDDKPLGSVESVGPAKPARFDLPEGSDGGNITLTDATGKVLLSQKLPLKLQGDPSRHRQIKAASDLGSAEGAEKIGDQMDYGRTIEKALHNYGKGSLGRGRIQYRKGHLDAAVETLSAFTQANPGRGEGWHLLGIAHLEKNHPAEARKALAEALDANSPYPPAGYYLALLDIADGKPASAAGRLAKLIEKNPRHWEARLLGTWLVADTDPAQALADARKLTAEDPADPRALTVLEHAAGKAGNRKLAARTADALKRICREEPGAQRRTKEFLSATEGEYRHPNRLKSF
ncbi:MAG: tetratricopeptide repeat protein [Phycisphaerae bacterium]